jgi:hypothetical protein
MRDAEGARVVRTNVTAVTVYEPGPPVADTRDEETSTTPPSPNGDVEDVECAEDPKITTPERDIELPGTEIVLVIRVVPEIPKTIAVDITSGFEVVDGTKIAEDI